MSIKFELNQNGGYICKYALFSFFLSFLSHKFNINPTRQLFLLDVYEIKNLNPNILIIEIQFY